MNNYLEENSRLPLNPTIEEGSTGENVIILQDKLKNLGYYFASIIGSFDEYTKMAVMQFQRDNNLNVTGVVNENTWRVLYRLTSNSEEDFNERQTARPVLRLGSTGTYVTELQNSLKTLLYYTGPISGNFDTATQAAVKTFQVNNRLTPDGIVGRDTWSALVTLYSPLAICDENGNNNGNETTTYIVVAGDSLWSIAQRFNTTVGAIKQLNNLTSDVILVGQRLIIPTKDGVVPSPSTSTYIVVAGDSLWKIAQRFNTTVDAIKRLNNLSSDNLRIGQQLQIPSSGSNNLTYIVVSGDSLWKIAQRFNTTADAIKRLNNLSSDRLNIGQQLLIPAK